MNFRFVFWYKQWTCRWVAGTANAEKRRPVRVAWRTRTYVRVCKYQIFVWYNRVELQVAGTKMYKTDSYECGRLVRVGKYPFKYDSYK
jgi:hypothetical protein